MLFGKLVSGIVYFEYIWKISFQIKIYEIFMIYGGKRKVVCKLYNMFVQVDLLFYKVFDIYVIGE